MITDMNNQDTLRNEASSVVHALLKDGLQVTMVSRLMLN